MSTTKRLHDFCNTSGRLFLLHCCCWKIISPVDYIFYIYAKRLKTFDSFIVLKTRQNNRQTTYKKIDTPFFLPFRKRRETYANEQRERGRILLLSAPLPQLFPSHLLSSHYTPGFPLSSNSDPESHNGPFSPLPTTWGMCLHFYLEKNSKFCCLGDSRRIVPTNDCRHSQHFVDPLFSHFRNKCENLTSVVIEFQDKR